MGRGTSGKAVINAALALSIVYTCLISHNASSAQVRTVRSGVFVAHFSELTSAGDVSKLLDALKKGRAKSQKYFGRRFNTRIDVTIYPTAGDYTSATGMSWWQGAAWFRGGLHFQPPEKLIERGVLNTTATHEYAHIALRDVAGGYNIPVWLDEGFAAYMSGEFDNEYKADKRKFKWTGNLSALNDAFTQTRNREKSAQAYKASYAIVRFMHERYGNATMLKLFSEMEKGTAFEKAAKTILKTDIKGILKNCAASLARK